MPLDTLHVSLVQGFMSSQLTGGDALHRWVVVLQVNTPVHGSPPSAERQVLSPSSEQSIALGSAQPSVVVQRWPIGHCVLSRWYTHICALLSHVPLAHVYGDVQFGGIPAWQQPLTHVSSPLQ
jgi:hypothetical protein